MTERASNITNDQRELIHSLFQELPPNYAECVRSLCDLKGLFFSEMAHAFQPKLNAYIQTLPHGELTEKQAIAYGVNGTLHELGLSIRCPRTGQSAILAADRRDAERDLSRFRLNSKDESGRPIRPFTSYELPNLVLQAAIPRREARSNFRPKQWGIGD